MCHGRRATATCFVLRANGLRLGGTHCLLRTRLVWRPWRAGRTAGTAQALLVASHEFQRCGFGVLHEISEAVESGFIQHVARAAFDEMIPDLRQRCQRIAEELNDLRRAVTSESFGEIATDRARRVSKPAAEFEIVRKPMVFTNCNHLPPKRIRQLPALKFSEVIDRHAKADGIPRTNAGRCRVAPQHVARGTSHVARSTSHVARVKIPLCAPS